MGQAGAVPASAPDRTTLASAIVARLEAVIDAARRRYRDPYRYDRKTCDIGIPVDNAPSFDCVMLTAQLDRTRLFCR